MGIEREPDAGDEMNRELFLAPSLIGDSTFSPLLDQARKNVADQARENMERQAARDPRELRRPEPPPRKPPTHEADGIVFASGADTTEDEAADAEEGKP